MKIKMPVIIVIILSLMVSTSQPFKPYLKLVIQQLQSLSSGQNQALSDSTGLNGQNQNQGSNSTLSGQKQVPGPNSALSGQNQKQVMTCGKRPMLLAENEKDKTRSIFIKSIITNRITGADKASMAWPWLAAITMGNNLHCTATILDQLNILTAAHCVVNQGAVRSPNEFVIRVGNNDWEKGETVVAERLIPHPKFKDNPNIRNDIALITLTNPLKLDGKQISTACLPKGLKKMKVVGKRVVETGWGRVQKEGSEVHILREANLTVISKKKCKKFLHVTHKEICALSRTEEPCHGDSGSPLMIQEPRTSNYHVLGVVSTGLNCKPKTPILYADVRKYLKWIRQNKKKVQTGK